MNAQDRKVMERVYACVNRMTGLGPSNPANLTAKADAFDRMQRASESVLRTLSCLNYGDYADAHAEIEQAEEILDVVAWYGPRPGANTRDVRQTRCAAD